MADDLADVPEQTVFFSSRTIRPARRRARLNAMLVPMTPPPMTTTSAVSMLAPLTRRRGRGGPWLAQPAAPHYSRAEPEHAVPGPGVTRRGGVPPCDRPSPRCTTLALPG